VALEDFRLSFGQFQPPLSPFRIDGATLHVGVRFHDAPGRDAQGRLVPGGASVRADVSMPMSIYLQTWEGETGFVSQQQDTWRLRVYDVDIDLPWWLTFGLVLTGLAVPLMQLPALIVVGDVLPTVLSNLEAQVARKAAAGINGGLREGGLASAHDTVHLGGLAEPLWDTRVRALSMTAEGLEAFATYTPQGRPTPKRDATLQVIVGGQTVRDGGSAAWPVRNAAPIPCSVTLLPGVADFSDPNLRVKWEVRRTDNGAAVLVRDSVYRTSMSMLAAVLSGSSSREIEIDHTSPELAAVASFAVWVQVYLQLQGRVKQLGVCGFSVQIADRFDRHHPYVRWEHQVLIPGGYERRRSAIHRTSLDGRCSMADRASWTTEFEYLDALPFALSDAVANRAVLCDYCFFGGPDKSMLRPLP
jgi:hypothetical protein